jgi:hypothetical protein
LFITKKTLFLCLILKKTQIMIKSKNETLKLIYTKSSEEFKQNLVFLLTWGAGIGGFMKPVNELLDGKSPSFNLLDINLLVIGILGTFFFEKKTKCKSITEFIKMFGVSLTNVITMLSYSFLIPVLITTMLILSTGQMGDNTLNKIVIGILLSCGITVIGKVIRHFLN